MFHLYHDPYLAVIVFDTKHIIQGVILGKIYGAGSMDQNMNLGSQFRLLEIHGVKEKNL